MFLMELPNQNEFLKTLWYLVYTYHEVLLRGLGITLLLAIVGTIGGFLISFIFLYLKTLKIDKKRDNTAKKVFKKIGNYFPETYTKEQIEEVIFMLLDKWKENKEGVADAEDTV